MDFQKKEVLIHKRKTKKKYIVQNFYSKPLFARDNIHGWEQPCWKRNLKDTEVRQVRIETSLNKYVSNFDCCWYLEKKRKLG